MATLRAKPSFVLLGGAVGVVLIVVLALLIKNPWPVVAIYAGLTLVSYVVAAVAIGGTVGELVRGLMIGGNAALNWVLAQSAYSKLFGESTGHAIAIVLGVLCFLPVFAFLARNAVFQGLLGYLNWLLPTAWLVVGLGLLFFIGNALGALTFGLAGVAFFKIIGVVFDWRTGTLFSHGGWVSNLNPIDTAYNMGNFAFVDRADGNMEIDHESGHTLNLAAFGSLFHLIGTVEENVINGQNALSEQLAESHVPNSTRPMLSMWA